MNADQVSTDRASRVAQISIVARKERGEEPPTTNGWSEITSSQKAWLHRIDRATRKEPT